MSASNSQKILDKTEPLGGIKHVKPTIKPKPVVLPRPKEIPGSENKSPLLSPTCGPCSPTLEIPSAIKISQLTGPQPYGTRRTSLKRWSSSVGEEVNQENNPLSPVENKNTDLPAKSKAQPLSASLKPLQTGAVWKGKSPFMLTTRGWGEQRLNQSRTYNESEAASQNPSSSLVSKDTVPQKRVTTAIEENTVFNLKSYSRINPEEKAVILNVQDSIASPEKLPSRVSEDITMVSSGPDYSNRPAEIKEFQKELSAPLQFDLHVKSSKPVSQYDHKEDIMVQSIGSNTEEKVPSVPVRESLYVPKSQTEDENVKNAMIYDNQIPVEEPGCILLRDDISVDQGHLENREKNHQSGAHVEPHDFQEIGDVIQRKYTQHTSAAYEQLSQHHDKQQPKDKYVTSEPSPPKPKERKKPTVQFNVPKADVQAEGRISMDYRPTFTESEKQETKEHRHTEDRNADIGIQHREDHTKEKPASHGHQKTIEGSVEEKQETSSGIDELSGFLRTQMTNYTMTVDNGICREDIIKKDPSVIHRSDLHNTPIQENIDVGQPDVDGSNFLHKEIKVADEGAHFISHTTKLFEDVEDGSPDVANKQMDDDVDEDHRNLQKGRPEADSDGNNVEYMPHFTKTPVESSSAPRSQHGNDAHSSFDSRTRYDHPYKSSTADQSEFHENTDRNKASLVNIESKIKENLPSQEYHASSAEVQPQEEMTQLKSYELNSSKSKSKEFNLSNFEDPTCRVIESMESSVKRDHKDEIQYLQDGEKVEHGVDESEDHHYSCSQLEEPLHDRTQSGELVHPYAPSQGLVYTYAPSEKPNTCASSKEIGNTYALPEKLVHTYTSLEEPVRTYAQSEEPVHAYAQSEKTVHTYAQSEEPIHTYEQSEGPVHTYEQSEGPVHTYAQSVETVHTYAQSEEAVHTYEQSEGPVHTYEHSEELLQGYPKSEQESHQYAELKKAQHAYDKSEKPVYTSKQSEEPVHHDTQSEEEIHGYTVPQKSKYESDQPEKLDRTYDLPEELIPHNVHSEESVHMHKLSKTSTPTWGQSEKQVNNEQLKESHPQDTQLKEPEKVCEHTEKINNKLEHPEEPSYSQAQSKGPNDKQAQSKGPNDKQEHSKGPNDKQEQSENPDYQHTQSKEPYYQQKYSEESHYQQEHSEELNYPQARLEELNFRHPQPENLEHEDKNSEESNSVKYYSEQSQQEDVQAQEGKAKVFGENNCRLTESTEQQEYMDLYAAETDSGHVTLAEQNEAESRPEKYLEQQHRDIPPEEYQHKDDSTAQTYPKELLSKEQEIRYAQQEETLDSHTVQPEHRDVLQEQQEHTVSKVINRHSQSHESRTMESQDAQTDDRLDKHTYIEKNINGHSELKESEYSEDRSGGPKLSDEIHEESPGEMSSDTEEIPEENHFDFLEGTNVLDTSLMRCRASLGKKRSHRTPATGTCTSQEETDPEYWMFRDSTELSCSPGKDSDNEEKDETSPDTPDNSPSSVKSPTKKGGIFSGMRSPSILKGRLKSRNKTSEAEATKTESKERQDPTSPEKGKSDSSSHSLNWLQALKKKKKKQPK